MSWATWLLFTGVPALCLACLCGVPGHLAPVHRSTHLMRPFACAVSWATWLLFTSVPVRRVVLCVRCPGPHGSGSPVCYYSALRPDSLQAHLRKPQLQVAVEQVPLLTRYHHWYARRSIHVPAAYGKCICGHTKDEPWDDFKTCHLYRGLDTSWTGTQPTPSHSTPDGRHGPLRPRNLAAILGQTEVLEAVCRGLVPTAVNTLLRIQADDPEATAAHIQRTAVTKTAAQRSYGTHKYLQHAATLPPADQGHLLNLLFCQP